MRFFVNKYIKLLLLVIFVFSSNLFSSQVDLLPERNLDINYTLSKDINLGQEDLIVFRGNCSIDGQGHAINLGRGAFYIKPGSTLNLKNVKITGLRNSMLFGKIGNLACEDNSGQIICEASVKLVFSGDFNLKNGSLSFGAFMHPAYLRNNISFSCESCFLNIKGLCNHNELVYNGLNLVYKY